MERAPVALGGSEPVVRVPSVWCKPGNASRPGGLVGLPGSPVGLPVTVFATVSYA
jgi:hypothetical protein